jgi:hypothetical protein
LVLRNIALVAKIRIEFQGLVHLAIGQQTSPVSQRIAAAFSNRLLKNYPQGGAFRSAAATLSIFGL